jgi:hypothetical protein
MGIKTRTITECTCDICHAPCEADESCIAIEIHPGDGRDVGPSYMTAKLSVNFQYGVSNGICCKACKLKFLRKYVAASQPPDAGEGREGGDE